MPMRRQALVDQVEANHTDQLQWLQGQLPDGPARDYAMELVTDHVGEDLQLLNIMNDRFIGRMTEAAVNAGTGQLGAVEKAFRARRDEVDHGALRVDFLNAEAHALRTFKSLIRDMSGEPDVVAARRRVQDEAYGTWGRMQQHNNRLIEARVERERAVSEARAREHAQTEASMREKIERERLARERAQAEPRRERGRAEAEAQRATRWQLEQEHEQREREERQERERIERERQRNLPLEPPEHEHVAGAEEQGVAATAGRGGIWAPLARGILGRPIAMQAMPGAAWSHSLAQ